MALVVFDIQDLEKVIKACIEDAFTAYAPAKMESLPDDNELLQVDEVAKLLNIGVSTLHTYKKNGSIPFHRIGRRVYFKRGELLSCLKKIN